MPLGMQYKNKQMHDSKHAFDMGVRICAVNMGKLRGISVTIKLLRYDYKIGLYWSALV